MPFSSVFMILRNLLGCCFSLLNLKLEKSKFESVWVLLPYAKYAKHILLMTILFSDSETYFFTFCLHPGCGLKSLITKNDNNTH